MLASSIAAYNHQQYKQEQHSQQPHQAFNINEYSNNDSISYFNHDLNYNEIPRTISPLPISATATPSSMSRSFGIGYPTSPQDSYSYSCYGRSINSVVYGGGQVCDDNLSMSVESDSGQYLPKLEADFCRNFNCCGIYLENLHQLLEHYESEHGDGASTATTASSKSSSRSSVSTAASSINNSFVQNDETEYKKRATAAQVLAAASGVKIQDNRIPTPPSSSSLPGTPMLDIDMETNNSDNYMTTPSSLPTPIQASPMQPLFSKSVSQNSLSNSCVQPTMLHPVALAKVHQLAQQQQQQSHHYPHLHSQPIFNSKPEHHSPIQPQQQQQQQQQEYSLQPTLTAGMSMSIPTTPSPSSLTNHNDHHLSNKFSDPIKPQQQQPQLQKIVPTTSPYTYLDREKDKDFRDKPFKCPVPVSIIYFLKVKYYNNDYYYLGL